jgi:hypothetical protein
LARAFEHELDLWDRGEEASSYLKSGIMRDLVPKRALLAKWLDAAGFKPIIPQAGYFMIADFSHLGGK